MKLHESVEILIVQHPRLLTVVRRDEASSHRQAVRLIRQHETTGSLLFRTNQQP